MIPLDLHSFLQGGSYLAIFFLMIANGVVSFPSSQFLYIIAGYFVGIGEIDLLATIFVGALGNSIGNIILYLITVRYGEHTAQKFLPFKAHVFNAIKKTFTHHGIWWLALAKLVPSLKVIVPILAGLARTPLVILSPILFVTSLIWATFFVYLGKIFGENFSIGSYSIAIGIIGIIVVAMLYKAVSKNIE